MRILNFVVRRSMCPEREPKGFHDWYRFPNGTWQLGFYTLLMYTIK